MRPHIVTRHVQRPPVNPESRLESPNTQNFSALCFYEGEIHTDKGAKSRDLFKRAISWAGFRVSTDSALYCSPSASTITRKPLLPAPGHSSAQHWQNV